MPVDPSRVNEFGDLVLTEPCEFEALADPLRLKLFDLVRRNGPTANSDLSASLDMAQRAITDNLEQLERAGLIDESDGLWTSDVKGIYFEIPDDPDLQSAARRLSSVMLASYSDLPKKWVEDEEASLPVEWARAAGLFNARVNMTASELRQVQDEIERALAPFTTRSPEETPSEVTAVRVLAYFLPASSPIDPQ